MSFKIPKKTAENNHEKAFRWYCEELIQYGYLKEFKREPELISVFPKQTHYKVKHLKSRKNDVEVITLLQETNYTYDFKLVWNKKAINVFTELYVERKAFVYGVPIFISHIIKNKDGEDELISYVDVKPHAAAARFGGGKMASFYTFPFIQKYLFLEYKLFINKIVPIHTGKYGINTCLFAKSFVPNRYLYTDGATKLRQIPYRKRSISSYVLQKEGVIKDLQKKIEKDLFGEKDLFSR